MIRSLALALLLLVAPPAAAADQEAARATAEALVEGAHGALADPGLPEADRDARLREAVSAAFAFDIWERFLLGERAETLSPDQQAAFGEALPGFLAHLYLTQFGKGLAQKPEIGETKPARRDVLVRARIPRDGRDPLPVDWRVREVDGAHKVIDVMVGGVSFLVLKREEFAQILDARGPEGLLAFMAENSL